MKSSGRDKSTLGIVPIVIFLLLWEIAARKNLFPGNFYFPSFSTVMNEFYYLAVNGLLGKNFFSSLSRIFIGFSLGTIAGLVVGILMGLNYMFDRTLSPMYKSLSNSSLGMAPLLMLWLGIGEILPITIIFICSFFPIVYNTSAGIKTVDKDYIKVAKTLGAKDRDILFSVVFL